MAIIHHYCDASSFVSIIESGKLRLTHARKTNDRRELEFLKERAFNYIDESAKKDKSLEPFRNALGIHFDLIEDLNDFHICCLSQESDSVGQWIAYADRGAGFAIGFDINALSIAVGAPILNDDHTLAPFEECAAGDWQVASVIYGDDENLRPHLDKILEFGRAQEEVETGPTQSARNYINRMCAYFKHPAFRDEKEWRIIYNATPPVPPTKLLENRPLPEIRWRSGKYGLTPYSETPNVLASIREVVVGPNNPDRDTNNYISEFLKSRAIGVKIVKSECPYR